ncbi:hypothetical protein [Actinocatenispora rupis]|uniref:hypothetical protein n=1 Tax=Actinocatenispora rupis TaxID=519421 RepID=UPI0019434BD6|nr:hypothetical protein [Actinocatenispora rupis]
MTDSGRAVEMSAAHQRPRQSGWIRADDPTRFFGFGSNRSGASRAECNASLPTNMAPACCTNTAEATTENKYDIQRVE